MSGWGSLTQTPNLMLPGWRVARGHPPSFQHRAVCPGVLHGTEGQPAHGASSPVMPCDCFPDEPQIQPPSPILPTKGRTTGAFHFSSDLSEVELHPGCSEEGGRPLSAGMVPGFGFMCFSVGAVVKPAALHSDLTGGISCGNKLLGECLAPRCPSQPGALCCLCHLVAGHTAPRALSPPCTAWESCSALGGGGELRGNKVRAHHRMAVVGGVRHSQTVLSLPPNTAVRENCHPASSSYHR